MSEFTDYVQFLSDAQSFEALQGQLVQTVGAAHLGILDDNGFVLPAKETIAAWEAKAKPAWIMLGLDEPHDKMPALGGAGTAFHLLVEEDFLSWTLALQCGAQQWSFTFLREPAGQYREATLYYGEDNLWPEGGDAGAVAGMSGCLGVAPEALTATLKADGGQAFSALVGATYAQMADLSFPYPALDPGEVRVIEED